MIFFYYRFFDFDMVKSHDLRDIAISHYKNGEKVPEISKLLANKVHRSTIDRWLHRYKLLQSMLNGNLAEQKLPVQNNAFLM